MSRLFIWENIKLNKFTFKFDNLNTFFYTTLVFILPFIHVCWSIHKLDIPHPIWLKMSKLIQFELSLAQLCPSLSIIFAILFIVNKKLFDSIKVWKVLTSAIVSSLSQGQTFRLNGVAEWLELLVPPQRSAVRIPIS